MFKTEAVILNIQRIRDNQQRLVLFTKEYGKVSCWNRKKGGFFDIWDLVNISIDRSMGWENIAKDIEIKDRPYSQNWKFETIICFLEILRIFEKLLPESSPHQTLFRDYLSLLKGIKEPNQLHTSHYFLFELRILKMLGFVNGNDFSKTERLQYIHKSISEVPIWKILESKPIYEEEWIFIKQMNQKTLYQLL